MLVGMPVAVGTRLGRLVVVGKMIAVLRVEPMVPGDGLVGDGDAAPVPVPVAVVLQRYQQAY